MVFLGDHRERKIFASELFFSFCENIGYVFNKQVSGLTLSHSFKTTFFSYLLFMVFVPCLFDDVPHVFFLM